MNPAKFWEAQTVQKLSSNEDIFNSGPIIQDIPYEQDHPIELMNGFAWKQLNVNDPDDLLKIYSLLCENYVSDSLELFSFYYSKEFIYWSLTCPGNSIDLILAIELLETKELAAFFFAIPLRLNVEGTSMLALEGNFLCVSKKFRNNRITPVLIQEIVRKAHIKGINHAIYTSGTLIHFPISQAIYYQKYLNPIKLEKLGFTSFDRTLGPSFLKRKYGVSENTHMPCLRIMRFGDIKSVQTLLRRYLEKFYIFPEFTEEEVAHFFLSRENIVYSYVVEESNEIVDFFSFYMLQIQSKKFLCEEKINVAYCFYYATTLNPLENLFDDMIICAKQLGADLFNALDIMETKRILKFHNFEKTNGFLNYFLYNWQSNKIDSSLVGKIFV